MSKVHLCCGDIYLKDYINVDIIGFTMSKDGKSALRREGILEVLDFSKTGGNPNETTLDKYFRYPFEPDPAKRIRRPFIVDRLHNILTKWPFGDKALDEVVMISCIEHFDPKTELPHILKELNRTVKVGGKLIIDWPDVVKQVEQYKDTDPEFMMELIYCNHKNKYSIHHWGFTEKTFPNYLGKNWSYEFKEIVKHDYPMMGCVATRIS